MIGKALLCSLLVAAAAAPHAAAGDPPRNREFDMIYSVQISELPAGAKRVDVWLPYPVSDEHQEVRVTEVLSPAEYKVLSEPEYGNKMLHLTLQEPQESAVALQMTVKVRRREYLRDLGAPPVRKARHPQPDARWLEPDRRVPLDKRVRDLAGEVTAGKQGDLAKARAIYDYVVSTMKYDKSGTGWGHGDIYWACDAKRGNCTDFHALFIGLARAVGIPAKFAIGFPIPAQRGEGDIGGYHCWAEFYLAGYGWVPIDASEAAKHPEQREYFFGAHDENRVQFTVGRDIVLSPRQTGEPLNFFIYPYVEVDGEPFTQVARTMRYKDRGTAGAAAGAPSR